MGTTLFVPQTHNAQNLPDFRQNQANLQETDLHAQETLCTYDVTTCPFRTPCTDPDLQAAEPGMGLGEGEQMGDW